ncbi:hypothetical protein VNO80_07602 [Phaseolus coccineus]|uniref:Thioesterase domain-containing protein n=1 Tax=Phaseolus coccineus TaxID=3886 RepID=A0AAN9NJK8_PHACN
MASKASSSASETQTLSSMSDQHVSLTLDYLKTVGIDRAVPRSFDTSGFYSNLFGSFLKVNDIKRGRISCAISVKLPIANFYGTLHGGSVASFVESLSIACARTVVAEDKELFLGEINVSYLSAAPINEEVVAEARVVKSGRNVTMIALEFKLKKTGTLAYIGHTTFYNIPVAKL